MSTNKHEIDETQLRRLTLIVSVIVFADTLFYAVITPLLPSLGHELHLSKLSAGVLTAAFPAGTLLGSLPGGMLAVRLGPRPAVYAGLTLMASSSLAFGLAHQAGVADLARFVQGIGGACSWAGGLSWLVAEAPIGRRGAVLGTATGAAIGGSLCGPIVGVLAETLGRAVVFGSSVVVALALGLWAASVPSAHTPSTQGLRQIGGALREFPVMFAMWLVALPSLAAGALNVLGPLRMHQFGAGADAIGATFLVGAAAEAILSPAVGRLSDRTGRLVPLRAGLALTAVPLVVFTLPRSAVIVGVVIVSAIAALGIFWAPVMAMLADAGEASGLSQGFAFALINLAWAGGALIGSGGGGALAKQTGDAIPLLSIAGVYVATLSFTMLRRDLRGGPTGAIPSRPLTVPTEGSSRCPTVGDTALPEALDGATSDCAR